MRVVECQICGDLVTGADDEELLRELVRHMGPEHEGTETSEDELREYVEADAYEATDS